MAKLLLTAAVPTVLTAASALAIWLCQSKNRDGESGQQPAANAVLPPSSSLSTSSADELSIVSWNVLADVFAPKLDYVAEEQLDWTSHRWPLIKQQLMCWGADLVLLQEVDVVWCVGGEKGGEGGGKRGGEMGAALGRPKAGGASTTVVPFPSP